MKILIGTDIEGVAGVVSFATQTGTQSRYYEQAKMLLTAEVNSAVEGCLESGVDEILVVDGHGSGAIHYESLHPAAKLMHGRPMGDISLRRKIYSSYDAAMMIGQHAMAGSSFGNLNHTQSSSSVDYYKLNNKKIGEIAQFALNCGALGVPLIFLSGDDSACGEVKELINNITTVSVKQGIGRNSAISLSAQTARNKIRTGVVSALERHKVTPMSPYVLEGPFILEKRFFHTDIADSCCNDPRYSRIDSQTVRIKSNNILDIIYS